MTVYVFYHKNITTEEKSQLHEYLDQHNISDYELIVEKHSQRMHWTNRELDNIRAMCEGDMIVAYDGPSFVCSTTQLLDILTVALKKQLKIYFAKYAFGQFNASSVEDTISLMRNIEYDFISKRTSEALQRRKSKGLALGRPKGRVNKELKLDQHKVEIKDYLERGISKASIAKLFRCHPQTLYTWIARRQDYLKSKQALGA